MRRNTISTTVLLLEALTLTLLMVDTTTTLPPCTSTTKDRASKRRLKHPARRPHHLRLHLVMLPLRRLPHPPARLPHRLLRHRVLVLGLLLVVASIANNRLLRACRWARIGARTRAILGVSSPEKGIHVSVHGPFPQVLRFGRDT